MVEQTTIDTDIINAALIRGVNTAWASVYNAYFPRLFQFIRKKFWQLSVEAVRDHVQQAFLKAVRTGTTRPFADVRQFDSWILTLAKNCVLDHLKSVSHRDESLTDSISDHQALETEVPGDTPATPLAHKVQQALASLSEQDRKLLLMRADGTAYSVIAAELGIQENAARTYYSRSAIKFKNAYLSLSNGKP